MKLPGIMTAGGEAVTALNEDVSQVAAVFTNLWNYIRSLLPSLVSALLVFAVGIMLTKAILKPIRRGMKRSNADPTAASFLHSLIRVALYVIVTVIALSVLKVPMDSIVTVIGTAGLAIGLALQDSLANVAGGFLIMFTKPLKVGDLVRIEDITGTVKSVGILQTKLVLGDGTTVFVPNRQVADAVIVNFSERALRRVELEVGISYQNDFETAKRLISELIAAHPLAMEDPAPLVRVGKFGDSAVILYVRVWTENETYWDLYYDLNEQILKAFAEGGISMPYPQLDVHFDAEKNNF